MKPFDWITGPFVAFLLQSSWAFAQPLVGSPLDCPAPSLVDARVREILGLAPDVALPERASALREEESLHVTLRAADGRVLGDRLLPAEGDCQAQAAAVAVLLATWLSDVHPEFVGNLPEAPPAAAPPAAADRATEAPPPAAPPTTVVAPIGPTPPTRDRDAARSGGRSGAQAARRWELGLAAGGALSSAAPVPLASLSLRYFPGDTGFGAALSATVSTPRREQLSQGSVRYSRFPLVLGPAFRVRAASSWLDASMGGAAAWLHVTGVNFQGPSTHDVIVFGGAVSARLALPQGRLAPFVELSGLAFQPGEAYVTRGTAQPSVELPNLELFAVLGGAFRAF